MALGQKKSGGRKEPLFGLPAALADLRLSPADRIPSPEDKPKPLERVVLVWGGSSSVGSCAIQLAVASGAEVVTTASPKNADYCKDLGAAEVFDYHSKNVEDDIVKWLDGKTVIGAYHAVGADGAVQSCASIMDRTKGKAIVGQLRHANPGP